MGDRRRSVACCAALGALAVLALTAVASAAPTVIARIEADTPISAYRGVLAFSQRDPATGRFALMTYRDGVTTRVAIAERAVPFDVDLGPDARGHTVGVYSRCATEPPVDGPDYGGTPDNRGRGCTIYQYDFATAAETQLSATTAPGASQFRPTISGTHIAFARVYDSEPDYPYLYARSLVSSALSTRLAIGPRTSCQRGPGRRLACARSAASTPLAMDLDWPRLAFAWAYQGLGAEGLTHEIQIDTVGAGARVVAKSNGGGISEQLVDWPSFSGASLFYATACFGDPQGCGTPRHHLDRYSTATGRHTTTPAPRAILGQARDGAVSYLLTAASQSTPLCGPEPGSDPSGCAITAITAR